MSGNQNIYNSSIIDAEIINASNLIITETLDITDAELIGLKVDGTTIQYVDATVGLYVLDGGITNAKVATGISAAKISSGLVSNTEFDYLNGVGSSILGKDDIGTFINKTIYADFNSIYNIDTPNLSDDCITTSKIANTAVTNDKVLDGTLTGTKLASNTVSYTKLQNGIPATYISSGIVDNTEFDYLNGLTSNIQDHFNFVDSDISDLQTDIGVISTDLVALQTEITNLGSQVSALNLQDVYDQSSTSQILTDITRGSLKLKSGVADTSTLLEFKDTTDTTNLSIKANGVIYANSIEISPTELSYLNNASSNIQTQITNLDSQISTLSSTISGLPTTMQEIYDNSSSPQLILTSGNPQMSLQAYNNNYHTLSLYNATPTETAFIDGNGKASFNKIGLASSPFASTYDLHIKTSIGNNLWLEPDTGNSSVSYVPTIHMTQNGQNRYCTFGVNSSYEANISTYRYSSGYMAFAIKTGGITSTTTAGTLPTITTTPTTRFHIDSDVHILNANLNLHDNILSNVKSDNYWFQSYPFVYANVPANTTRTFYFIAAGHSQSTCSPYAGELYGFCATIAQEDWSNYTGTITLKFYINSTLQATTSAYTYTSWTSGRKSRYINGVFGTPYSITAYDELSVDFTTSSTWNLTGCDLSLSLHTTMNNYF